MSEHLFLAYANHTLKDNIGNLGVLFEPIAEKISDELFRGFFGASMVNLVEEFLEIDDPVKSKKFMEEIISKYKNDFPPKEISVRTQMAYEAVYGYRKPDSRCGDNKIGCRYHRSMLDAILVLNNLDQTERLKCVECFQFRYIAMLKSLTEGRYSYLIKLDAEISEEHEKEQNKFAKELFKAKKDGKTVPYNQYPSVYNPMENPVLKQANSLDYKNARTLKYFLFLANHCFYTHHIIGKNGRISPVVKFYNDFLKDPFSVFAPRYPGLIESRFNRFVGSFVGHSLRDFIINDDLKKLKICQRCHKFFISKKRDKRIKFCPTCSKKSKMTKEVRREYQKRYYWNKKLQKIEISRELMIQKYMENLDCTREEAEALYNTEI
jgi:hypothetical protein